MTSFRHDHYFEARCGLSSHFELQLAWNRFKRRNDKMIKTSNSKNLICTFEWCASTRLNTSIIRWKNNSTIFVYFLQIAYIWIASQSLIQFDSISYFLLDGPICSSNWIQNALRNIAFLFFYFTFLNQWLSTFGSWNPQNKTQFGNPYNTKILLLQSLRRPRSVSFPLPKVGHDPLIEKHC